MKVQKGLCEKYANEQAKKNQIENLKVQTCIQRNKIWDNYRQGLKI